MWDATSILLFFFFIYIFVCVVVVVVSETMTEKHISNTYLIQSVTRLLVAHSDMSEFKLIPSETISPHAFDGSLILIQCHSFVLHKRLSSLRIPFPGPIGPSGVLRVLEHITS